MEGPVEVPFRNGLSGQFGQELHDRLVCWAHSREDPALNPLIRTVGWYLIKEKVAREADQVWTEHQSQVNTAGLITGRLLFTTSDRSQEES
jgi:hypothetical protein